MATEKHLFQSIEMFFALISVALSLCLVACSGADGKDGIFLAAPDEVFQATLGVVSPPEDAMVGMGWPEPTARMVLRGPTERMLL